MIRRERDVVACGSKKEDITVLKLFLIKGCAGELLKNDYRYSNVSMTKICKSKYEKQ